MFYVARGECFCSPWAPAGMFLSGVACVGVILRLPDSTIGTILSLVLLGFFLLFFITERIEDLQPGPDTFFFLNIKKTLPMEVTKMAF